MKSTTVAHSAGLRVGTGSVNLSADDSMVVAGSILPRHVKGQEGELRAVAIVIEKPPTPKLAIVVCDVIVVTRDDVDAAVSEIERTTGIPPTNILISATHTHHAPSTIVVHGYGRDETFCQHLREGIIRAVQQADANLSDDESHFYFHQGEENTVGGNSRLLLADGTIWWVGPRTDAVRPTGPFDPQLPVFAFRDADDQLQALMYNHSTHTIGTCNGDVRSPSFYGLTAQELEAKLGGSVCFLPGAFGSTHNVTEVPLLKRLGGSRGRLQTLWSRQSRCPLRNWRLSNVLLRSRFGRLTKLWRTKRYPRTAVNVCRTARMALSMFSETCVRYLLPNRDNPVKPRSKRWLLVKLLLSVCRANYSQAWVLTSRHAPLLSILTSCRSPTIGWAIYPTGRLTHSVAIKHGWDYTATRRKALASGWSMNASVCSSN